jgi:hypothetical protein
VKLNRLGRGEAIAAVSALALLAFMFLAWYGSEVSGQARAISFDGADAGGSAWQALDLIPFALALTVAVTIGAALLRLLGSKWQPAIPPSGAVAVLGGLSFLLILFRIVFPPGFGTLGGIAVSATLELGAFLGLAAASGIACGGYRAMGERGTSFAKIADGLGAGPAGSAPGRAKRGSKQRPAPRS